MEKYIKTRAALRATYSKKLRLLEAGISEEEKDMGEINALFELIEKKSEELADINAKIQEELIANDADEETLEREMDAVDEYRIKFCRVKNKVTALREELREDDGSVATAVTHHSNRSAVVENRRPFKLPQLELKKFSGELMEWLPFWTQFSKIHADPCIDEEDKFQYLIQATVPGSKARILVDSFPAIKENYSKVIEGLKARYGREDLLVEFYVRDLLSLVLQNTLSHEKMSLSNLYDKLESRLRALETLHVTTERCAAMLMPLVESCLPEEVLRTWQRSDACMNANFNRHDGGKNTPQNRLEHLMSFLRAELENEEKIKLALTGFSVENISASKSSDRKKEFNVKMPVSKRIPTAAGLLTTKDDSNCVFCGNNHRSLDCSKAQKLSVQERKSKLNKMNCCYSCFKVGHRSSSCWSKIKCNICGRRHNVLLCDELTAKKTSEKSQTSSDKFFTSEKTLANIERFPKVYLQTLVVKLRNNGYERNVRAIIDSASQRSYILKETAAKMKYGYIRKEQIQHALFGGLNTRLIEHKVYKIHLSDAEDKYRCNFEVLDQEMICDRIPPIDKNLLKDKLRSLNIKLTDYGEGPIEILIGADVCGKLFTGRKQQLSSDLVAIETDLGWTIIGRARETKGFKNVAMIVNTLLAKEVQISDLWSLDVLGIEDPSEKKKKLELQAAAEEHFLKTVDKDEQHRYQVHLPFLENHPSLPDNYGIAVRRLHTTIKKLKSEGLFEDYDRVFKEWMLEEIIEEVPVSELDLPSHYLPHRHVVKENSTTRIRPVFDASAKEKNKPSLNSCLEKGVNLIEKIPAILARFRLSKIGVISDIRKAFLQISVVNQDRNFLRFLWVNELGEIKMFRHCRVVFGVTCSPFLLGSVIIYHLRETKRRCKNNENSYSMDIIDKLLSAFYVDNCVSSVKDDYELNSFIKQATAIMCDGKFDLRGWEYSHQPPEDGFCEDTHVLGLIWNKNLDTLEVNVENFKSLDISQVTKRTILSASHKLFDPVGIVCPVLLLPKLLLQQICATKIGWDQEVDEDVKNKFVNWFRDLYHLRQVKISRWLFSSNKPKNCTIHVFCDASQHAYAAVVFLRTVYEDGNVNVQLVQAKSRISPRQKQNKTMTIPRLELLAATMGVRLYQSVAKDLSVPVDEVCFWSDSTTVLAWITREDQWDVFVRNRVEEIRQFSLKGQWRHVHGVDNPADLPSRGCSAKKLLASNWWLGPEWLKTSSENWSLVEVQHDEEEINKERKKSITSSFSIVCSSTDASWYYRYFSNYKKIIRMIAWMIRFKNNASRKRESRTFGEITADEYLQAEKRVLFFIQRDSFSGVDDPKIKSLCPFVGDDGLVRIKTKISYREDFEDFRFPILLPSHQHPVVNRLIVSSHEESSHAGVQSMLTILRNRFWILNGRRTIRSVINSCVICKRHNAKRIVTNAPPLPVDRIRDAKVFEIVGIDLAGPIYIKHRGSRVCQKAWICLFTCAVYRAVHLELISSVSTDHFLQCLRKFISRRGRPTIIYSDNGANFVGSANALSRVDWDKLQNFSAVRGIRWKFNPPTAAWWGGWWERLIGLMKNLLRRVLNRTSLDWEEMETVLCECESVINSRPLTYVSEDSSELMPLTPNMFLQENTEIGIPDLDCIEALDYNRRLRYRLKLRSILKQRFRDEYLGKLILHSKRNSCRNVKVGEIVIVENDNKRVEWPLARVEELMPGREGVTRLVKLRTSTGTLLRPVQKIYPLEIEFSSNQEKGPNLSEELVKSTRHGRRNGKSKD